MISIGGIIGAGLFVSSSTSIIAGGPASFISYAICGLLILLVMRMLAKWRPRCPMCAPSPSSRAPGLGEGAGFVVGWLYWYFWVLVVPVEAIAGAKILHAWLPAVLARWKSASCLMAIMTCVNLMSARSYAEFEFWFASIKVAAIIVFIAIAASFAFGLTSPSGATFGNLVGLWRLHAQWLDRGDCGCSHGVLRHDGSGNHHHRGGRIGTARPRSRAHEQRSDLAHLDLLCDVDFPDRVGDALEYRGLRRIALHPGAQHHACAVGTPGS